MSLIAEKMYLQEKNRIGKELEQQIATETNFWYDKQTCSQDRQCQDQDQDRSVRDQDRKWQYETKCTQFTQKLLLSKTSKTLIDVKFTTEYCI